MPAEPNTSGEGSSRLRILVVEDHADTASMMKRILEREGHSVELAGTLAEACEKAGGDGVKFDLLVTDIEMPDGTAYELIAPGRPLHGTRAIVVSGHGMQMHLDLSREAGFREHLIKPFSITQLRDAIWQATRD